MNDKNVPDSVIDLIQDLKYDFLADPGRRKDHIQFCAVDNKSDLERIDEIDDFYWMSVSKEAYFFIKRVFEYIFEGEKQDTDSPLYIGKDDFICLDNELDVLIIFYNYYTTFDKFYSVCKKVYGENNVRFIEEKYSEVWEYLRDGIQRVYLQIETFLNLCYKNNKTVWMFPAGKQNIAS